MRMSINLIIGIVIVVIGLVAYGALFTVDQTQQAIVMQFGEPKRVITEPGLAWKIPMIQNVQYYEKRVLNLDPPAENILLSDQKRATASKIRCCSFRPWARSGPRASVLAVSSTAGCARFSATPRFPRCCRTSAPRSCRACAKASTRRPRP